jgi:hypothetical protein
MKLELLKKCLNWLEAVELSLHQGIEKAMSLYNNPHDRSHKRGNKGVSSRP